jgi:MFS family permease
MSTNVDVAFDAYVLFTLLTVATIGSIYLAGRIAERRGRRFKIWAWVAAMIGPLALPLLFLFPNLQERWPRLSKRCPDTRSDIRGLISDPAYRRANASYLPLASWIKLTISINAAAAVTRTITKVNA